MINPEPCRVKVGGCEARWSGLGIALPGRWVGFGCREWRGMVVGTPLGRDPRKRGDFRLRLPRVQVLLCRIRKNVCPDFQPKAKTTPDGIIRQKTAPKTCPYRPLWMDDPMFRQAGALGVKWGWMDEDTQSTVAAPVLFFEPVTCGTG